MLLSIPRSMAYAAPLLGVFATSADVTFAQTGTPIGFLETFALAEDRGAVLDQLVAGTDEHDYFTSLHLQQTGSLDAVDRLLRAWKKRSGETAEYRQIEARQALLRASNDPRATYEFLEDELGIGFDHERRVEGRAPDLPTQLDASLVDTDVLLARALRKDASEIGELSPRLLARIVGSELSTSQRSALLERLPRPDVPGLVDEVLADFAAHESLAFGGRSIHTRLTLAQLERLADARPRVLANQRYVDAVMTRLALGPDASIHDPEDRGAYLERAWRFVSTLPSAFDSLKAHVLYHRLEHDLATGNVSQERVERYLRLRLPVPYVVVRPNDGRSVVDLAAEYRGLTPFQPIGLESEVVTDSLSVLFRDAETYRPWLDVLEETFARRIFAETKLLYGDPSRADQYLELLGGAAPAEALQNRVEIEFSRTNRTRFDATEPVTLLAEIKNVDELIVKVFEVDAVAVFDRFGHLGVGTLDLDGLVPGEEFVFEYDAPPLSRHLEEFTFAALEKPGIHIVEMIGGGVSSRAVVHKGALHLLARVGSAGHVFRVLDSERAPVDDAILRFGARDFTADEKGEIFVPFTTAPGRRTVLLRRGDSGAASIASFEHLAETYALEAGVHAPIEALIAGMDAEFTVRPRLSVAGERVPIGLLEEPEIVVESTDVDGHRSTEVIRGPDFDDSPAVLASIRVPERSRSFSVFVRGKVRSLSEERDVEVRSAGAEFPVNEIGSLTTTQALLTRTEQGYVIELRGRNGELREDVGLTATFEHLDFDDSIRARLKSGADGRVVLGPLERIETLQVKGSSGVSSVWRIAEDDIHGRSGHVHGRVGETLRIPYGGTATRAERSNVSLVETRLGQPLRDAFESVAIANRYLVLQGLAPGEYTLTLVETGEEFDVSILDGEVVFGHVVGEHRALDRSDPLPLQIVSAGREDDALFVQLAGVTDRTRVHVVATKFVGRVDAARALSLGPGDDRRVSSLHESRTTFESGRRIGDEARYILERRTKTPYPGNMLERSGYLLNPWVVGETDDSMMAEGRAGTAYRDRGDAAMAPSSRVGDARKRGRRGASPRQFESALDFLAEPAEVVTGLVPGDDGRVRIPLEDLGPNHLLRVVAFDDHVTTAVDLTGPARDVARRDRRLRDALDPANPMTEQRRVTFVDAGETIEIRNAAGAGAKTFATLGDVFEYFRTVHGEGAEVTKFAFMASWPSLDEDAKRVEYSEFVCHELNVFLREKDPAFFESVVRPYLLNKGHRTFMDDWLLGTELAEYLEPWRFETLNVVEKILLLRSTGGDAARMAQDRLALAPRGTFSLEAAFDQILATGGLSADTGVLGSAMDEVRRLDAKKGVAPGAPATPAPGDVAGRTFGLELEEALEADEDSEDTIALGEIAMDVGGAFTTTLEDDLERRQELTPFYRDLDETKELAETHYWRVRLRDMGGDLITASPFWVDFAEAGGDRFVSGSFPLATRNTAEMLLALAFLDLPFESDEHDVQVDGLGVRITAASPMYLALQDIQPAGNEEGSSNLLIGQDFFFPEQRTIVENGVEREHYVTGEFLTGRPYGLRAVATNPSSAPVDLQLLLQIPEGAIPLADSFATKGVPVTIGAYGTEAREAFFYFPEPGTFDHFPVHAGDGDALLGAAEPRTLTVVDEMSSFDEESWDWISQNAELDRLLAYLAGANPLTLDLDLIAWRMRDRASFDAIRNVLVRRNVYDETLWQYALLHRAPEPTSEYLAMNERIVGLVGPAFESPLLQVEPRERAFYEHLAYDPLVNGRTYAFRGERRILNAEFARQYMRFLQTLALKPTITDDERVELAYYLLLQARTAEALALFDAIDREDVPTKIQYDYMAAYMAFFRSEVTAASAIAERYTEHPVERWRNRFRNVIAQVREIEGKGPSDAIDPNDRDQTQGARAASEPVLGVAAEGGRVIVDYERIDEVELRYHLMDIEFLFSSKPFVRGDEGAFGLVQPTRSETLPLDGDQSRRVIDLPTGFETANVIVEVRGGGIAKRVPVFAGDLVVQGLEKYGQIKAVDGRTREPLPATYVKVYARLADGTVRFHKDGYTDLRGRFDYVSLSGVEGSPVEKYALLVMSNDAGARIEELEPPAR